MLPPGPEPPRPLHPPIGKPLWLGAGAGGGLVLPPQPGSSPLPESVGNPPLFWLPVPSHWKPSPLLMPDTTPPPPSKCRIPPPRALGCGAVPGAVTGPAGAAADATGAGLANAPDAAGFICLAFSTCWISCPCALVCGVRAASCCNVTSGRLA